MPEHHNRLVGEAALFILGCERNYLVTPMDFDRLTSGYFLPPFSDRLIVRPLLYTQSSIIPELRRARERGVLGVGDAVKVNTSGIFLRSKSRKGSMKSMAHARMAGLGSCLKVVTTCSAVPTSHGTRILAWPRLLSDGVAISSRDTFRSGDIATKRIPTLSPPLRPPIPRPPLHNLSIRTPATKHSGLTVSSAGNLFPGVSSSSGCHRLTISYDFPYVASLLLSRDLKRPARSRLQNFLRAALI